MDGGARDFLLLGRPMFLIIDEVAKKHGFKYVDLIAYRRSKPLIIARQEAYWRCKNETGASYPEIARAFDGRDHTTIMWGVRQHEKRMGAANGAQGT